MLRYNIANIIKT